MNTVTVHRAGDFPRTLGGLKPIEPCTISILPSIENHVAKAASSLECTNKVYQEDAAKLAQALFKHLPQGTQERLIIELMRLRVSSFAGPASR